GATSFDRLASRFRSRTHQAEEQPCHPVLKDPAVPEPVSCPGYAGPAARYGPGAVDEDVGGEEGDPRPAINAQNCVHSTTCDITDPPQNIDWVTPEGGGGPNYPNM